MENYGENSKKFYIYTTLLAGLIFIFWLLSFLNNKNHNLHFNIDALGVITISVIGMIVLLLFKDTYYFLPILTFAPFMFAKSFYANSIPHELLLGSIFAIIGIIGHLIIHKPKFQIKAFSIGVIALSIGAMLGGVFYKSDNYVTFLIMSFIMGAAMIVVYTFLASNSNNHAFDQLAFIMIMLSMLLVSQMVTYGIINKEINIFEGKSINVGWGVTNNIAMILLISAPFSGALLLKKNYLLNILGMFLIGVFFFAIVFNYSRGGIFAATIIFPLIAILGIFTGKSKLLSLLNIFICTIFWIVIFFLLKQTSSEFIDKVIGNIKKINLESLNGRAEIYKQMLGEIKNQPLFGFGMFHTYETVEGGYLWGHNVFIQTIYTTGAIGTILMIIHLIQKYLKLLIHPNPKKMVVLFAFLGSGIYGLMDVSYYFINFMIVLFVILIAIDWEIDNGVFIND